MLPKRPGPARGRSGARGAGATGKRTVSDTSARGKTPRLSESPGILQRLRRRELVVLARQAGVRRASRLTKESLIRALAAAVAVAPGREAGADRPVASQRGEGSLPADLGRDRLVLLPLDPYWVHAYWELAAKPAVEGGDSPDREDEAAPTTLRVYDVTFIEFDGFNAHSFFDIVLTPEANNWYINLWSPEKSLCAELGRIRSDGTFVSRVRSNVISTPPAWPSPHTEQRWMQVRWTPEAQGVGQSGGFMHAAQPASLPVPAASSADLSMAQEGMKALKRPAELVRAEDFRRFFEALRRARVLGRPVGFPSGEDSGDSEAAPSSGQWIRQNEQG